MTKIEITTLGPGGMVAKVEHVDMPGTEVEKLQAAWDKVDWCECGLNFEFGTYPEDGKCGDCNMHKHHVHCARCGGIHQIG